jgi:hypothetical protein
LCKVDSLAPGASWTITAVVESSKDQTLTTFADTASPSVTTKDPDASKQQTAKVTPSSP